MTLKTALGLENPLRVALVGGGGKTSAMYMLGSEVLQAGGKAILTTTTRVLPPPPSLPMVLADSPEELAMKTQASLAKHPQVLAARGLEDGKVVGIPCSWLDQLTELGLPIICEADGSQGKPLKFPAPHEPVLCPGFSPVLVIGLQGLSKPLDQVSFHRHQLALSYLGWQLGMEITSEAVTALLNHPQGWGRLARPLTVLLNQADTEPLRQLGAELALILLQECGVQRVVVAALAQGAICGIYQ